MINDSTVRKIKTKNNKRKKLVVRTSKNDHINIRYDIYKKKDQKMKAFIVFLFTISFITMSALVFYKKITLTNLKKEYNGLDSQEVSYQITRDRLKTDLEKAIDIDQIQRYAREKLGMVYATDKNTISIEVDR